MNILHRDLKSANVFLYSEENDEEIAKLGDLNVSKLAKQGLLYTQTGTPYYASPEVWKDQPYDSKSDVWSLGCVCYEMCALVPPFRAENMDGLFKKVQKGQFSRIPAYYSDDLNHVIKKLLSVNPQGRPSCEQILNSELVQKNLIKMDLIGLVPYHLLRDKSYGRVQLNGGGGDQNHHSRNEDQPGHPGP